MNQPTNFTLTAVGLRGSAPGACGLTQLVVKNSTDLDHLWLLDTDNGLRSPITHEEFNGFVQSQGIRKLSQEIAVTQNTYALYTSKSLLDDYQQITKTTFPWGELNPVQLDDEDKWVVFNERRELMRLRERAGELFLTSLDQYITKVSTQFFDQMTFPRHMQEIEDHSRLGALCVGSESPGLYWQFHQRIAAAVFGRHDQATRLGRIYEIQIKPILDISRDRYDADARSLFASWMATGERMLKQPKNITQESTATKTFQVRVTESPCYTSSNDSSKSTHFSATNNLLDINNIMRSAATTLAETSTTEN